MPALLVRLVFQVIFELSEVTNEEWHHLAPGAVFSDRHQVLRTKVAT